MCKIIIINYYLFAIWQMEKHLHAECIPIIENDANITLQLN